MTRLLRFVVLLPVMVAFAGCATDLPRRARVFDEQAFLRVTAGMEAEQVLERIGTPTRVVDHETIIWYYGTGFPPRSLIALDDGAVRRRLGAIYFTKRLKVARIAVYARLDNIVLDVGTGNAADAEAVDIWRSIYEAP